MKRTSKKLEEMKMKLAAGICTGTVIFGLCILACCIKEPDWTFMKHNNDSNVVYAEEMRIDYPEEMSAMPCLIVKQSENKPVSLGTFRLTAYCSCEKCCGKWALNRPNGIVYGDAGKPLKAGFSIAVDPSVIPYGTEVIINGHVYEAMDCGSGIDGNCIDIYFDNHQEACNFGEQYAEVFIK